MESNPIRMCELLVGLPDVNVLGVDDVAGEPLRVHIETRGSRPVCPTCGGRVLSKDRPPVELVDLAAFGRPTRLVWHKHRWSCPDPDCGRGSWTAQDPRIAAPRLGMSDRAGRWVTRQVGKHGRTVAEVARELDCDWHTVNDTVLVYGRALLDADTDRVGWVLALGLDGTLFARFGQWRTQAWATSIVDVNTGILLDMVPGRDSAGPIAWLESRAVDWRAHVPLWRFWTCPGRTGPCSTVPSTTSPRSPTRSTWFGWRTTSSTSADGESPTRPSDTGAGETMRCIGPASCWSWPRLASTTRGRRRCSAC